MQNQFGQVEDSCLDEALRKEYANLPENLFTIMTSYVEWLDPQMKECPYYDVEILREKSLSSFLIMTNLKFRESGLNAPEQQPKPMIGDKLLFSAWASS